MKAHALRIGKAISAALFVLLLVVVGSKNALAQTSYIVTLQHGDDISTFYGQSAFSEAYIAAISGDIITLSSGTYSFYHSDYSSTISKALTIRGAGCTQDSISGIAPTVVNYLDLNVPESEGIISIEGIQFGSLNCQYLYNPKICKCRIDQLSCNNYEGTTVVENAQFVNCFIIHYSCNNSEEVTAQFINCVVGSVNSTPSHAGLGINNSIVFNSSFDMALIQNSILISVSSSPTSIFQNCIGIYNNPFEGQQNSTNWQVWDLSDVFETFNYYNSYNLGDLINEQFVLKSEVASTFLGTDGTEVGIHGGLAPYKLRPNYMVLKRCNVASQSTIDNKLSVEIEVISEGE